MITQSENKETASKCEECHRIPHKWNTIKVLACGGDYEDWPCPKCRPKEYENTVRDYYL